MSGMRGINFAADQRSSATVWSARPHAKNVAARKAWDHFAKIGEVYSLRLTSGCWVADVEGHIESEPAPRFART